MENAQHHPPVSILIVEDERVVVELLKAYLETTGYTVCGYADTGEKAIEMAELHRPDLILMDIILVGKIDGIEAAEMIRSKMDIPVVFITAHYDKARLERAKLVKPFGYLIKPFQRQDLMIAVEMALHVARLEADLNQTREALRQCQEQLFQARKMEA